MANGSNFTVHIYAKEYAFLEWLVLQKQRIETGGDLFGVWESEASAIVQLILGPGRQCQRTTTSFHQDVKYLENVGRHLTQNEGICNIGEWHSHHRLGLASPSAGDKSTVWNNFPTKGGGRFLLFIANISNWSSSVQVGCFMFNAATHKMTQGRMEILPNCSPLRHRFVEIVNFKLEAEQGQDWDTFRISKLQTGRLKSSSTKVAVSDLETNVSYCVCDIEDEMIQNEGGCCTCLVWMAYKCFRATLSAVYRCCSCCIKFCFAGILNFTAGYNRRD